ncbi:MAG: NAD(+)/NADH kinase [Candidatus Aenigmarchaeota archaeon]|nr:NAD(+)/NADH kinase [Candidatus Aenigmarchaeota archaeon]
MKVFVVGLKSKLLEKRLLEKGFVLDYNTPEVVFTYGGDGTILASERSYPGVPKVTIKHSLFCYKCAFKEEELESILTRIKNKKHKIEEHTKIKTTAKTKTLVSLNEIQLHNKKPTKAIRFNIYVDKKILFENVVGDGVVIATPYGSTAYYKSVGGKSFKKGIGIALNNPHTHESSVVVNNSSEIEIEILRECAQLFSDNDDKSVVVLNPKDRIIVKKHLNTAKFIV